MHLRTFEPQSNLLKKYIDHFYVLEKPDSSESLSYYTFPNIHTIVSINKYADFVFNEHQLLIKKNTDIPVSSTIICSYTHPIEVCLPGYVNEITICFKPLGINRFLEQKLCSYANKYFAYFNPYQDFLSRMRRIMDISNAESKIEELEIYLVGKYKGFDHPFLTEMVSDLYNEDMVTSGIDGLAQKYGTTRKTVCKQFEQHIGKTPSELRRIIRFRQALERQQRFRGIKTKFSDIAYQFNFFDQSHLIKDFKSITGMTPKTFFKSVTVDSDGRLSWLFI